MNSVEQLVDGFCRRAELDQDVFSHYILGPMMPCFVEFAAPAMLYITVLIFTVYRIHQLLYRKSKVWGR